MEITLSRRLVFPAIYICRCFWRYHGWLSIVLPAISTDEIWYLTFLRALTPVVLYFGYWFHQRGFGKIQPGPTMDMPCG